MLSIAPGVNKNRSMITIITHLSTPQTSPISSRKPFLLPRRENWRSDRSSHRCVHSLPAFSKPPQDGGAFVIPIAQRWTLGCRKCLAQGHRLITSRINISSSACLVLKPHSCFFYYNVSLIYGTTPTTPQPFASSLKQVRIASEFFLVFSPGLTGAESKEVSRTREGEDSDSPCSTGSTRSRGLGARWGVCEKQVAWHRNPWQGEGSRCPRGRLDPETRSPQPTLILCSVLTLVSDPSPPDQVWGGLEG